VVDIPTTNQAVEMCYYCSTAAVDAVDAGEEKNHKTGMREGGRPPGPTRYHDRHVHGSSPSGEGGYGRACVWWRNLLDLRLSSTQWHPQNEGERERDKDPAAWSWAQIWRRSAAR
jgi:hypothetical protein